MADLRPSAVRVLANAYDNPITVGRVYRVVEWRKVKGRKGLYPRIYDDCGRTITLDRSSYEAADLPPPREPSAESERIVSALSRTPCEHTAQATGAAFSGIDCGACIANAIDDAVAAVEAKAKGGSRG